MKQLKEPVIFYFGPRSIFSHWYRCSFIINDIEFCCVEQYLMYSKALLFKDAEVTSKILRSSAPKRHRYLGRKVKGFIKTIWQSKCKQFAFEGNLAKFNQDTELQNALIKTEVLSFAEVSPYDRNWGIGLSISNPKIHDRQNWRGKNWCGRVLESVRENIVESMSRS